MLKKTIVRLYTVIVRVKLVNGCEAWTISVTERRSNIFENHNFRIIYERKLDTNTGMWRRKINKKLTEETGITPIIYYPSDERIQ